MYSSVWEINGRWRLKLMWCCTWWVNFYKDPLTAPEGHECSTPKSFSHFAHTVLMKTDRGNYWPFQIFLFDLFGTTLLLWLFVFVAKGQTYKNRVHTIRQRHSWPNFSDFHSKCSRRCLYFQSPYINKSSTERRKKQEKRDRAA